METNFLFTAVEMVGMVAFALYGALVGLKYRLDLFGILLMGITASLGGGVIRDLLIGITPPAMFRDYRYLLVAVVTSLVVFLAAYLSKGRYHDYETKVEALANVFDALGLGAFNVVGVQAGINAGFSGNGFLLVFLGLMTGIGGGILRDLFVLRMPVVFPQARLCPAGHRRIISILSPAVPPVGAPAAGVHGGHRPGVFGAHAGHPLPLEFAPCFVRKNRPRGGFSLPIHSSRFPARRPPLEGRWQAVGLTERCCRQLRFPQGFCTTRLRSHLSVALCATAPLKGSHWCV